MQVQLDTAVADKLVNLGLECLLTTGKTSADLVGAATALRPLRPDLGQYWEGQGGVVAGESRDKDGRIFTLIWVCDRDLKPITTDELEFGTYDQEVEGAGHYSDGLANTRALAAAGSPIANAIFGKSFIGNDDCYLPSIGELSIIRANLADLVAKERFWSSTQFDSYDAWSQSFSNGNVSYWGKDDDFKAFPVRRVYR